MTLTPLLVQDEGLQTLVDVVVAEASATTQQLWSLNLYNRNLPFTNA